MTNIVLAFIIIPIKLLGENMRFSNLHTHTLFSDGTGGVRENIESAIQKNMSSLGISDHSFTACDQTYCMKLENYPRYESVIKELKREYEGKIPVFLGIEKDFYSETDNERYDYLIASIHYMIRNGEVYAIDHKPEIQMKCINDAFGGSVLDFAKAYYEMAVLHAEKAKPTFIGHIDVINKFSLMPEDSLEYQKIASEAVAEIIKYCPVFEVNTGAIARGYRKLPYPAPSILKSILDFGGELVLNSDSHRPENLDFFFGKSVEIIKAQGFDHILEFTGEGFKKITI